jgi:hypothetical protein
MYKNYLIHSIAWPVAYLGMHQWLQGFANRVSIRIGPFVLTAALPWSSL